MDYLQELTCCELCEHRCRVNRLAGERGVCRVTVPEVASRTLHPAPPESYTIFMAGCNFKCLHCQNWTISQYPDNAMTVDGCIDPQTLARESVARLASPAGRFMGADRIFFSGGEPTVHLPYIERLMAEARDIQPGLKVNFDTNGFMTERSLERVLAFTSSITFDLKAYYDETHRAVTGAPVGPVLRNAETVGSQAPEKLWEYRIVVIPGVNEEDIEPLCRFVASISPSLPVCFLAFRPNFVLEQHPGASLQIMKRCVNMARRAGLRRVTWSGVTGIPGSRGETAESVISAYRPGGARLAASYAWHQGCQTHPRDCRACPSHGECPIKRFIPARSC